MKGKSRLSKPAEAGGSESYSGKHNPKVVGSSPAPATKQRASQHIVLAGLFVLGLLRRQIESYGFVLKFTAMSPIAERLVLGEAAAAYTQDRTPLEIISIAVDIHDFDVALYAQRAIRIDRYFGGCHFI